MVAFDLSWTILLSAPMMMMIEALADCSNIYSIRVEYVAEWDLACFAAAAVVVVVDNMR